MTFRIAAVAIYISIQLGCWSPTASAPATVDSIRLGIFPFNNRSRPDLSDADLERIAALVESEVVAREVVTVLERERIKEIWAERQHAEEFPDIYDPQQFVRYRRVFQVTHGLLGEGFINNSGEIVIILRVVDGETSRIWAGANTAFSPTASHQEETEQIRRLVDLIFGGSGKKITGMDSFVDSRPPRFISIPDSGEVAYGDTLQFSVTAVDDDGDSLAISMLRSPDGAILNEVANGLAIFTYSPAARAAGDSINPEIYVTDGRHTAFHEVRIRVLPGEMPRFRFGLEGRFGDSQLVFARGSHEPSQSYGIGAFVRWPLRRCVALQSGVLYSKRGSSGQIVTAAGHQATGNHFEYDLGYIDIPLSLVITPSEAGTTRIGLQVGTYMGISTMAQFAYVDSASGERRYALERNPDIGLLLGLRFEQGGTGVSGRLISMGFCVYFGLTTVVDEIPSSCIAEVPRARTRALMLFWGVSL